MSTAAATCVIIPCYNNCKTIVEVMRSVVEFTDNLIVVFDGCTDGSNDRAKEFVRSMETTRKNIHIIDYQPNRGKGKALQSAFRYAAEQGFDYAVTLDADGQHYADDIPLFLKAIEDNLGAMILGCRCLTQDNMSSKSTFANKFSNFWFTVQTGLKVADTQTGFRAYPLSIVGRMNLFTNRYEAELEYLLRIAWRDTKFVSIPIKVYYAPANERVTHFRPGMDFTRISILNTVMCFVAILYGYPSKLIHHIIKGGCHD